MSKPVIRPEPPYRQIAAQIRARIAAGELRAGEPVPSTRRIAAEWKVAMATATKALAELQRDGLVRVVPGTATVVSPTAVSTDPSDGARPARPTGAGWTRDHGHDAGLSVSRAVSAAVAIADAEGLGAVTMRRVAAELGVGAMSIYRHVPGKAELVRLMADSVFARCRLPKPGPDDWRDRLEVVARQHWDVYRRHPWVAAYVLASPHRPQLVPTAMDHLEWELQALLRRGLDELTTLRAVISLHCFVGGVAMSQSLAHDDRQGADATADPEISGKRFPTLTRFELSTDALADLDSLFEFGLQRHLDGLVRLFGPSTRASPGVSPSPRPG